MLLYVLDALDASQRAQVRAHLSGGCPQCIGAMAEAEAVVAQLALAPEPMAPPASVRERLMKAAALGAAGSTTASSMQTGDVFRKLQQTASTAAASSMQTPDRARELPQTAAAAARAARRWHPGRLALAACVGAIIGGATIWLPLREHTRLVTQKDVQFVSMTGGDPQPGARGRIFWDTAKNNWHVYVFDMKPPPPGKTYELWFITPDQKKVRAGTFDVDARGRGSLVVNVPADLRNVAVAAVTDEPAGGVEQPTGQIQLVGKVEVR